MYFYRLRRDMVAGVMRELIHDLGMTEELDSPPVLATAGARAS